MKRLTGVDITDSERVSLLLVVLGEEGHAIYKKYGYKELFPYFKSQGLLTIENLIASGGLDAIDELVLRYGNNLPFSIVSGLTYSVAIECGVKGLTYLYSHITSIARQYLFSTLSKITYDLPHSDPLVITIKDWLLTTSQAGLLRLLHNFTTEEDLEFILRVWKDGNDIVKTGVMDVIGYSANYPLFVGFMNRTGVLIPFEMVWERNDNEFLSEALANYTIDEVSEVLSRVQTEYIPEETKEVLQEYGIEVV
ncbi:MAG: hypothetical protein WC208_13820 [Gallionella sp.]